MTTSSSSTKEEEEEEVETQEQPTFQAAVPQGKVFDATTSKGVEDGLFQACMTAIRSAHFKSNRIRAALVVTGLFTDVRVYRDVISIFYLLTKELEAKLQQHAANATRTTHASSNDSNENNGNIAAKIWKLGYRFTEAYQKDLAFLYSKDYDACNDNNNWEAVARQTLNKTPAAVAYLKRLQAMSSAEELAGAAFVLMGALVIGGGAAALPRVQKRYGANATHLFQQVAGPGRDQRKRAFIACWDSLASTTTTTTTTLDSKSNLKSNSASFQKIVAAAHECMQGNNNVLSTLARNPWWLKHVMAGTVGLVSIGVAALLLARSSSNNNKLS